MRIILRHLDRETLLKNHFWILMGTFLPLMFIMLVFLWTTVEEKIVKEGKDIETTQKSLQGLSNSGKNLRNTVWLKQLGEKDKQVNELRNQVWENLWNGQASLMKWPDYLVQAFKRENDREGKNYLDLNKKDFRAEIEFQDVRLRYIADPTSGGYHKMIDDMIDIVQPVNLTTGKGVVQFHPDGWQKVVRHDPKWYDLGASHSTPSAEDVWLAQEDLWVQRELFEAVRRTNDAAARLDPVGEPKTDQGEFANSQWQLALVLVEDKLRYKITNISGRQQRLAFAVRLRFGGAKKDEQQQELVFSDEPLAANESSKEKEAKAPSLGSKGLQEVEVEQVLDWRSAPVKRIDAINLCCHSHRDAHLPFVAAPAKAAEEPKAETSGSKLAVPGSGISPSRTSPSGGPDNNPTNRYLVYNEQVRRMGLGLVLIVDQAYIQDILKEISNSRLRIQITQVQWRRYRESLEPILKKEAPPDKPGVGAGAPPGHRPSPGGAIPMPGGATSPTVKRGIKGEVVELSIYGIASLYQRYPEAKAVP